MNRLEILEKVGNICQNVFEDNEVLITEKTIAENVKGWDSLSHLSFINEVENEFKIKFTMKEMQTFKNIGELIDSIEKYIGVE